MRILLIGSEGYIGSSLKVTLSIANYNFETCDLRPSNSNVRHYQVDYGDMTKEKLSNYEVIILLAAHSSVKACVENPMEAIQNNVVNFMKLLTNLNSNQILVYASSGSVYDGYNNSFPTENARILKSRNIYDYTKISNDFMASCYDVKTIGLRFGTLSGQAPTIREDLIINKMTADAINRKVIQVSNGSSYRSCLAIKDLNRAFDSLLSNISLIADYHSIFNLSSFSHSINEIAAKVSNLTGAPILVEKDSPTYNFSMSTKKFEKMFNFKFTEKIETIVKELMSS